VHNRILNHKKIGAANVLYQIQRREQIATQR